MSLSRCFAALSLLLAPIALASPLLESALGDHANSGSLLAGRSGKWYHPEDHFSTKLFKRDPAGPQVGSDAWLATYPDGPPDVTAMPDEWKNALAAIEAAGLVPNIPQSNEGAYPPGIDSTSAEVCSSTAQCQGEGDVWNAPDGMLGVSFDDGPTTASPTLYDFLKSQGQKATHFMIGLNIKNNIQIFQQAFANGDDIATHTYTHRYMTNLTNEEVVAELGYTQQIISDLTGGRVPAYWRPPYGDSDNRVRAIAKYIFGIVQVDWNQDTNDWELGTNQITPDQVAASLQQFITGPKTPGLIILEHELYPGTVQAFVDAYPLMKSQGWDTRSIPDLWGNDTYLNVKDSTTPVATTMDVIVWDADPTSTSSSAAAATNAASASAASASQSVSANKAAGSGKSGAAPTNARRSWLGIATVAILTPLTVLLL